MKFFLNILSKATFLCVFSLVLSCNYLDIVPDDKPTLEDAFKNENEAQKSLFGLYSLQPDLTFFQNSPSFIGGDETIVSQRSTTHWYPFKAFLYEEVSVNNPWFNYFSNNSARITTDLYAAIRSCYQFINRLSSVPNINPENLQNWTGEAEFLIAYYHFLLMEFYGPIVIVDKEYSPETTGEELMRARSNFDDCVDFVVAKLDAATEKLPISVGQADLGRATKVIAKSLKSRLLLFAASPLYNGNAEYYSQFLNSDGSHLINQVYSVDKWERAKNAAQDAIELAESSGFGLFYSKQETDSDPFKQAVLNYRYATIEKYNSEIIWGYDKNNFHYSTQRYVVPKIQGATGSARPFGQIVPTLTLIATYYTKNGLPLEVDPTTKGRDLWKFQASSNTAEVNLDREPRFYASIGYDGGTYEFNGSSFSIQAMNGQPQGFQANAEFISATGYFLKKWAHPKSSYNASTNVFSAVRYPYPEIRLAELYLNYVEADFEKNGSLNTKSFGYINAIRKRSGIPNLQDSWAIVGGVPNGDALRQIIHLERAIEFAVENKRFFDLRRWKMAHIELNKPQYAWNIEARTKEEFYKRVPLIESGKRSFTSPRNYLHPIHIQDVNVNQNLVQNPGW